MTTREHLKAFHEAAATHHTVMAKSHKKLAGHYSKATGMDGHQDLADEHKAMSDSHATMAEHHLAMCKSIGDEMGKAAGDRMIPDRISGIITHWPSEGIKPVPRFGSPEIGKAAVAPEFQHLIAIEE